MRPTHSLSVRSLIFTAVIGCCVPLHASTPAEVKWSELCRTAAGAPVSLTTASGSTVEGYCVSINVDEVSIQTQDHRVVKVARKALAQARLLPPFRRHQLSTLRRGFRKGLHDGFDLLLSPYAPAGAVLLPATVVWGVAVAPFCALGELKNKLEKGREITVI